MTTEENWRTSSAGMNSDTFVSWVALVAATPAVLVLLTWSISRQRNYQEKHDQFFNLSILTRGNSLKYVALLKSVLSLQLLVQFTIFLYTLLYKLLGVEQCIFLVIYAIQVLTLMKSLMGISIVLLNSISLSGAFVKYHVVLMLLLSLGLMAPTLLHQISDFVLPAGGLNGTDVDIGAMQDNVTFRVFVYYLSIHGLVGITSLFLICRAVYKATCGKCPIIGCELGCTCTWRNKTCLCLMILCVLCTNATFIAVNLVEKFPEGGKFITDWNVDLNSVIVWAQVIEGCFIVLLLDPVSQCRSRRSQIRLLESPSSSYHLSETRIHGRRAMQGAKFPITNGSLFASLTAVAMSRPGAHFLPGFDLKCNDDADSRDNTFDKFKTYTKDVDSDETHSVTTIANDDFEFHHHIPPAKTEKHHYDNSSNSTTTTTATITKGTLDDDTLVKRSSKKAKEACIPTVSLSLYESASMNDLDSVQSCHQNRLYKKNARHSSANNNSNGNCCNKSDKKVFRRAQSCESIPAVGVLERSYLDNGGFCEHYDEKVVFVTDFI